VKVMRTKYFCLFLAVFLIPAVCPRAFDFGLVTNQYASIGNQGSEDFNFNYQADILPRLSFLIGEKGELLLSAGFTFGAGNGVYYVPELLHTEFSMRFGSGGIKVGRFPFSDPLSFIANGLFDGVQYSHNSSLGTFSAGLWYTGLLYKRNAKIAMTESDKDKNGSAIDYGDFADTYFASSRLLFSLDWEHLSIAELLHLQASFMGQFDLTKGIEKYHSQYFTLKAGVPVKRFLFELGGSFEMAQLVAGDTKSAVAFAWDFGIFWTLPSTINSRLSLSGHFAGGRANDKVYAFVPITTKSFGNVLQAAMSGLSVLDLNYTARLSNALGTSLSALLFVRNDLTTYTDFPVSGSDGGYFLGSEFFARFVWSPISDLQFNLGGGMFLPALGNVNPKEKPQWNVVLNAVLALY